MVNRTLFWDENQSRTFDYVQDSIDTMIGLAQLAGDLLGQTATVIGGIGATASSPASLSISLAAGSIYQLADIDATTEGAISQNTTQILQQGIVGAQTITLETTGLSVGQSQWQLIEAQFSQSDSIRTGDPNGGLLYFYNSTTPSSPFQGPDGDGATTPTVRKGLVTIQVITGSPATTGSETPPSPTEGWVPLYLIDLSYGQTQITQAEIYQAGPSVGTGVPTTYQQAPFLAGLTNSHHGGVAGQAPQIKLASEVQGVLPYANMSPVRATLTANLNLYVATNGSDTNDGLTSQTPFATLQKAWNTVIEQYDLGGHSVTINVESGTYTAGVACISNPIGAITGINNVPGQSGPSVIFLGNTTTPDSVVIDVTGNNCFQATNGAQIQVNGFRLVASGTSNLYNQEGVGLYAFANGGIQFANIDFGPCSITHINCTCSSIVESYANPYTISGSSPSHVEVSDGSYVTCAGSTVTITGDPEFSTGFVVSGACGNAFMGAMTFNGNATGPYYNVNTNGVISTDGAGDSYFPGNSAGSASTGGQYV